MSARPPCKECPWRKANHEKPHPHGFYTLANLRRLWDGLRRGDKQSCHPTDPSCPDHGAKPGAEPEECRGSVILILRELQTAAALDGAGLTPEAVKRYGASRKGGLTRDGFRYWLIGRLSFGQVPFVGGGPLPEVDPADPNVGLPAALEPKEKGDGPRGD